MKTDYIYNMPAGKEMDTLIAEKVMGLCAHDWKLTPNDDDYDSVCRVCQKCHLEFWGLRPPAYGCHYGSYSTNIAAAWEVVEKMKEKGKLYLIVSDDTGYKAEILLNDPVPMAIAQCDTAPLAICRVALLAVMEIK
jgi:hypothetical protein